MSTSPLVRAALDEYQDLLSSRIDLVVKLESLRSSRIPSLCSPPVVNHRIKNLLRFLTDEDPREVMHFFFLTKNSLVASPLIEWITLAPAFTLNLNLLPSQAQTECLESYVTFCAKVAEQLAKRDRHLVQEFQVSFSQRLQLACEEMEVRPLVSEANWEKFFESAKQLAMVSPNEGIYSPYPGVVQLYNLLGCKFELAAAGKLGYPLLETSLGAPVSLPPGYREVKLKELPATTKLAPISLFPCHAPGIQASEVMAKHFHPEDTVIIRE